MGPKRIVWFAALAGISLLTGCSGDVRETSTSGGAAGHAGAASTTGGGGTSATGGATGVGGGGAVSAGAGGAAGTQSTGGTGGGCPAPVVEQTWCGGTHLYACGDGLDNDGDGLVDSQDPECLGACDNDEGGLAMTIPDGDVVPCVRDCYFDDNGGPGDDDCHWSHRCDPNESAPPGHPEPISQCPYDPAADIPGTPLGCTDLAAEQSATCASACGPLTPNGCDCFGCCELPAASGKFVYLGSEDEAMGLATCTMDVLADPTKCEPCTPVPSCYNACETCELCVGKGALPPECAGPDGAPLQQCPEGQERCGLACQPACPSGTYCVTGCCQPAL